MFWDSIRSFGEPVGISPVAFEVSDTPRQNSIWRPTVRRIKRGLFSNKSPLERNNQQTEPDCTISNPCYNGENQQWLNNMEPATTRRGERVTSTHIRLRSPDANTSRDHTNVWKDPNQSGGFRLIKRSLSKSKQRAFGSDTASLVGDQRAPIERESGSEQIKPTTAICVPGHVPSEFSNMTAQRTPRQRERELTGSTAADFSKPSCPPKTPPRHREQRKPVTPGAAYVPKHAASDFSKMKQSPKSDNGHPLQPGDSVTIRPAGYEPSVESTDYQNFLASARITAARTYNSHGIWSSNVATTNASKVMDNIMANHNLDVRLQQTISKSKRSSTTRPVSGSSIFGKVGDYLKPPRPLSGITDGTTANHNNSLRLQPTNSVSQRSIVTPRPVSSGGMFEKFGNYIKLTRPESAEITTKRNTEKMLQRSNSVPRRPTVSRPMSSGGTFEKVENYIKPARPLSGISYTTNAEDDKISGIGISYPQDRLGK